MKRKIFSILFALLLVSSFSLVMAVPVAVADSGGTFTITNGTYATTAHDPPDSGDIKATLTGAWDSAVIGEFSATDIGGLYVVGTSWGTTASIDISGTLSELEIAFSGTAVWIEGDDITDDKVTGIAGTLTIEPDGAFGAALTGLVFAGTDDELPVTLDIGGFMARDITNGSTGDSFFTIQAAVDAADSGDTISVGAGTYDEQVVIDKNLILQGDGKEVVIITGAVTIKTSDIVVDGFRINGTVYVDDSASDITGATISDNYITGASYGIMVGTASENVISQLAIEYNDIIGNDGKGICFWKVDWQAGNLHDVTIRGNTISGNGSSGISTYGAGPYIIVDNIVSDNSGNGISIKYDAGDIVTGNTVTNNDAMGINMHQVTNCTVENNTISGHMSEEVFTTFWGGSEFVGKGSGIYLHEASLGNAIQLNSITGNLNGVLVASESGGQPSGNSIVGNTLSNNYDAILVQGTDMESIVILDNTISEFVKGGIVVKGVLSVQIEGNAVSTTNYTVAPNGIQVGYLPEGVPASTGTVGTINDNQVSGCHWDGYDPLTETYEEAWTGSGILVIDTASALTISGNEVQSCDVGLDIEAGSGTLITGNSVRDNSYGLVFWNTSSVVNLNSVYQNALCGIHRTYDLAGNLDATNNWWGHSSGPGEVGSGSGDTVSTNVNYEPWLLAEGGDPYDKTISLPAGWSLISPDKGLSSYEFADAPILLEYADGFVTPVSAFIPLTAVYAKTLAGGGGVGFNYAEGTAPTVYSKDLDAGWNLIGVPDMEEADTHDILSPLRYVTVGMQQVIGLTTLVSQGEYNQFSDSFYDATLTDEDWEDFETLHPLDGYWAYMEAADTFEVIQD